MAQISDKLTIAHNTASLVGFGDGCPSLVRVWFGSEVAKIFGLKSSRMFRDRMNRLFLWANSQISRAFDAFSREVTQHVKLYGYHVSPHGRNSPLISWQHNAFSGPYRSHMWVSRLGGIWGGKVCRIIHLWVTLLASEGWGASWIECQSWPPRERMEVIFHVYDENSTVLIILRYCSILADS